MYGNINNINHFYYCLLIAIKIMKKERKNNDSEKQRSYIKRWLQNAQKREIFDKIVYSEIQWLLSELSALKFSPGKFEHSVERIYIISLHMVNRHKVISE